MRDLPDTSTWLPRRPKSADTLRRALEATCRAIQRRVVSEAAIEREFNIDNFDSGPGLEDVVRRELRRLLPQRYTLSPGVVNDATGCTVGDCDVLISNCEWAQVDSRPNDCFYLFFVFLLSHLTRSILYCKDVVHAYGDLGGDVVFHETTPPVVT